jgi:hypothetical protein
MHGLWFDLNAHIINGNQAAEGFAKVLCFKDYFIGHRGHFLMLSRFLGCCPLGWFHNKVNNT